MLKVLVVTACLLIVGTPTQTKEKPANGSGAPQTSQSDQRGTQSTPLIVDVHAIQSNEEAAKEADKDTWEKHINVWSIGLTFAIALCALAQVVVYLFQTRLLNNTLRAIERQAEIASNAQRSWIVSTSIARPDFSNPWIQHMPVHFKVIGNSPVRVTESNFRVRLVPAKVVDEKSDTRQPDLPEKPDYANPATLEDSPEMGTIRAPGTEFSVIPMLESLFLMEGSSEVGGGNDVKAIRSREKFLTAYGFIKYQDAFSRSKIRETRFCYVYSISGPRSMRNTEGWNTGGPPPYNECT